MPASTSLNSREKGVCGGLPRHDGEGRRWVRHNDAWYYCRTAASGTDALAILDAREAVDLMITDLSMPGMDGLTLIR